MSNRVGDFLKHIRKSGDEYHEIIRLTQSKDERDKSMDENRKKAKEVIEEATDFIVIARNKDGKDNVAMAAITTPQGLVAIIQCLGQMKGDLTKSARKVAKMVMEDDDD